MSCRTNCCKRFFFICSLLAMATVVLGLPQLASAQNLDDPNGVFQMDGNAVKDPATGTTLCFGTDLSKPPAPAEAYSPCPTLGSFSSVPFGATTDDWSQVYAGSGGHYIAHSFDTDTSGGNSDPTTFLGTSTKDTMPINQWAWQAHSVQSKDDIAHAYAAAYGVNGQIFIYVGMDRFANNGDSTAGFWFVQDSTFDLCTGPKQGNRGPNAGCTAAGTFAGSHTNGDLLIVSDFSQGGAVSTINIFIWNNGLSSTPNLTLSPAPCNPTGSGSRDDVCGLVNNAYTQGTVHGKPALIPALVSTGGWSFTDTFGNHQFATGEFLELGVNLNNPSLFGSTPPCFSTFFAETRSSTSVGSSLSDLVAPVSFPLCSVTPTKQCGIQNSASPASTIVTLSGGTCTAGEATAGVCDGRDVIRYTFSGSITGGGQTLYHPNLTDNPPAAAYVAGSLIINGNAATPGVAVDLLSNGTGFTSVSYTGQFDSNAILGDSDRNGISVTASSSTTGTPQNIGPDTADWGPTKTNGCNPTPAPGLELAKLCNSCLTSGTGNLIVQVNEGVKVCNTGNVPLTGVSVNDCQGGTWTVNNGSATCSGTTQSLASGLTLPQSGQIGACQVINSHYNPTSVASCNTTGQSGCSSDQVIASGSISASFGGGSSNAGPISATCPLCPLGDCKTYLLSDPGFGIP